MHTDGLVTGRPGARGFRTASGRRRPHRDPCPPRARSRVPAPPPRPSAQPWSCDSQHARGPHRLSLPARLHPAAAVSLGQGPSGDPARPPGRRGGPARILPDVQCRDSPCELHHEGQRRPAPGPAPPEHGLVPRALSRRPKPAREARRPARHLRGASRPAPAGCARPPWRTRSRPPAARRSCWQSSHRDFYLRT